MLKPDTVVKFKDTNQHANKKKLNVFGDWLREPRRTQRLKSFNNRRKFLRIRRDATAKRGINAMKALKRAMKTVKKDQFESTRLTGCCPRPSGCFTVTGTTFFTGGRCSTTMCCCFSGGRCFSTIPGKGTAGPLVKTDIPADSGRVFENVFFRAIENDKNKIFLIYIK